jgi:hypothetical protein
VLAPDLASGDVEDGALTVADLGGGELVGLEDRHDPVHAGLTLEAEAFEVDILLDVADGADDGQARPFDGVGEGAGLLDPLYYRSDLLLGGGLSHYDHHRLSFQWRLGMLEVARRALEAPARVALGSTKGARCGRRNPLAGGRRPKRLAKSPGAAGGPVGIRAKAVCHCVCR